MLKLKKVSKFFPLPSGEEIKAVDDVSFELSKGDFAVLIGPNGAGKSTLFDLIAGRIYVDKGRLFFNDSDITFHPPHRRARYITLLSQLRGEGLPRAMRVTEIIKLALESRKRQIQHDLSKYIQDKLDTLEPGLSRIADNQVWHLSGGEYQLVSLLLASILCELSENGNHVLLLDEHLSQLAPGARERVLRATIELVSKYSLTVILSTHSPYVATSIGNRQIVLKNGKIEIDLAGNTRIKDPEKLHEIMTKTDWNLSE